MALVANLAQEEPIKAQKLLFFFSLSWLIFEGSQI